MQVTSREPIQLLQTMQEHQRVARSICPRPSTRSRAISAIYCRIILIWRPAFERWVLINHAELSPRNNHRPKISINGQPSAGPLIELRRFPRQLKMMRRPDWNELGEETDKEVLSEAMDEEMNGGIDGGLKDLADEAVLGDVQTQCP